VITLEKGDGLSRLYAVAHLVPLVAISVLPFTLRLAGPVYLIAAVVLGGAFLGTGLYGFIRELGKPWARQLFFVSLIYLSGLFVALIADHTP
jgi:protoheme IX farnesyltransferase